MRSWENKLAGILLAALAVLIPITPLYADYVQKAEIGFDNHVKSNYWTPVRFYCQNDTGKPFEGEFLVVIESRNESYEFHCPISLPSPSRKVITAGVYCRGNLQNRLLWYLMRNNRVMEKGTIQFQVSEQDQFILAITNNLTGLNLLNQRKLNSSEGRIFLIPYTPNDVQNLPDQGFYYESVDALLWGDVPPDSLRPAQIEAIEDFIQAGGCLIAWGGPAAGQFENTWMESLLPVHLGERQVVNELPSLAENYLSPIDLNRGWVIGTAKARKEPDRVGEVLLKDAGLDLLVRAPLGLGWTTYVAFDLTSPQFALWPAAESFLGYLLHTGQVREKPFIKGFRSNLNRGMGMYQSDSKALLNCYNSVQHDPVLLPPSFQFISAFLLIYVLIVGPVNYLILRHKKRLELTWLTIPIIVLLFLGAEYTLGWNLKGKKTIVNSVEILSGHSGDPVLQQQALFGLFSPSKRRYEIDFTSLQGRVLPLSFNSYEEHSKTILTRQTQRISLDQHPMNMWTMETFWAQGQLELDSPIACELNQTPQGLKGQLNNLSSLNLKYPCIIWEDKYYSLPDVAAGESLPISSPRSENYYSFNFADKGDAYKEQRAKALYEFLKGNFIENPKGVPFLIAWVDPPESIRLGEVSFDSRWEVLLGLRLSFPGREQGYTFLDIPESQYQVRWIPTEDNLSFDQMDACHFTAGSAQVELLPITLYPQPTQISEMNLRINLSNPGKIPLQLELYDWKKRQWLTLLGQVDVFKKPISLTDQRQLDPISLLRPSDRALRLRFQVLGQPSSVSTSSSPMPLGPYPSSPNQITVSNLSLQIKGRTE